MSTTAKMDAKHASFHYTNDANDAARAATLTERGTMEVANGSAEAGPDGERTKLHESARAGGRRCPLTTGHPPGSIAAQFNHRATKGVDPPTTLLRK